MIRLPSARTSLLLLALLLLTRSPSPLWAQGHPRRALLLVWDSGDASVVAPHGAMVDRAKALRAEGHFAQVSDLHPSIKVYDFHTPSHARSLALLGLSRAQSCPALAVIALDKQGLPAKVLWSMRYSNPDEALAGADAFLGLTRAGALRATRRVVLVTDSETPGSHAASEKLMGVARAHAGDLKRVPNLTDKLYSYDFARPEHRQYLERMGLSRKQAPFLAVIAVEEEAYRDILWSLPSSARPEGDWQQLLGFLKGKSKARGGHKICYIIWNAVPSEAEVYPAMGKLEALLPSLPVDKEIKEGAGLPEIGFTPKQPTLALVDCSEEGMPLELLWSTTITSSESAVSSLCGSLGVTYKAPVRYVSPLDGSTMMRVQVSGGILGVVGANDPDSSLDEQPAVKTNLNPFYLGRTEITVAQFRKFVEEVGYTTEAEAAGSSNVLGGPKDGISWKTPLEPGQSAPPDHPVEHITFNDALKFCEWAGLRLPQEREWEVAARGPEGLNKFPWGEWHDDRCRSSVGSAVGSAGGPTAVGQFPQGASPFQILDMAGNVYEWVNSPYLPHYPDKPPPGVKFNREMRILKGGAWPHEQTLDLRCTNRAGRLPNTRSIGVGFRVASN